MTIHVLTFLLTSLIMSLLILGVAALGELFPKVFSARLRYVAWLIVLVGLIIPVRPMIGSGLIRVGLSAQHYVQQGLPGESTTNELQIITQQGEFATVSVARALPESTHVIIILIWITVATCILTFHIWRYVRFVKLIKRWGEIVEDETTLSVFRNVLNEMGLANKHIGLRRSDLISTSMLIGFSRPMVLLPKKHFDADELEMIFRHELVHYKRRDLFVKLVMLLVTSVYWFNPVVYLMNAVMQADCEASCDEAVLREVGKQNNQFYAELIIDMIGDKKMVKTALSTCFYGSKRSVKKRMDAIMDTTGRIGKLSFAAVCAVIVLTVMSGSVFAFYESQTEEQTTDEDGLITATQARDIALSIIEGGAFAGFQFNDNVGAYMVEIIRGTNRYYLMINAISGAVTIYQSVYIGENEGAEPQTEQDITVIDNDGAATHGTFEQSPAENQTPVDDANVQDAPANMQQQETPAFVPQNTPSPNQNHGHNQNHNQHNQGQGNHGNNQHSTQSGDISMAEARAIALAAVGGGRVVEAERYTWRGQTVFEIVIVHNRREYEVLIGSSGEILRIARD